MSGTKLTISGYSGHGYVVADAALASGMGLQAYTEKQASKLNPFGLSYLGFEGSDDFDFEQGLAFILGIGDNAIRQKIALLLAKKNKTLLNVIHPAASLSGKIMLGKGIFIARNAAVNPLAQIGDFSILNTGCIIEHECVIGDAAHIAPGAVLAGNVQVGERSFIGANAVIKQGVKIGRDVIVGAGSVVLSDIPDHATCYGNPAKRK